MMSVKWMKGLLGDPRFWTGAAGVTLLAGVLSIAALWSGWIDMAALPEPGWLESAVGEWAVDASRDRRAPRETNPSANDPAAARDGLSHYRENCLPCHGAPGFEAAEFAEGLHPPAPRLTIPDIQALSDGELWWTVRNGIRMTGMPAFAPTHTDEEIWKIVAAIRRLPRLGDEEKAILSGESASADHHHGR